MTKNTHLFKVTAVWVSTIYTICYLGVAFYPNTRGMFMRYAMHANMTWNANYFGPSYFISGLLIWNVVALLAVWFFIFLLKEIK